MLKKVINNILHVKNNDLKLKRNLFKTLKIGALLIVLSIINVILDGFSFGWISNLTRDYQSYELLFLILRIILFAAFEEIFFRVIIQKSIYEATDKSKKSEFITIIASSIIFSLCHLVNIISDYVSKMEIVMQLWSTFVGGIYLGTIYMKTENWLGCTIIHAIYNISLLIIGSSEGEISNTIVYNIAFILNNIEEFILLISTFSIIKNISKESEDIKNET